MGSFKLEARTPSGAPGFLFGFPLPQDRLEGRNGVSAMEKSLCWQNLFQRWPDSIPKLGIVVISLNEGIALSHFSIPICNSMRARFDPRQRCRHNEWATIGHPRCPCGRPDIRPAAWPGLGRVAHEVGIEDVEVLIRLLGTVKRCRVHRYFRHHFPRARREP